MNIKELKEIIADLPDDLEVCSCCSSNSDDTDVRLKDYWDWVDDQEVKYLWVGYK